MSCGFLQSPENGRLILLDGTSVGSVARYECNPGFVLSGSAARSCESDGNWSGVEPICESEFSYIINNHSDFTVGYSCPL